MQNLTKRLYGVSFFFTLKFDENAYIKFDGPKFDDVLIRGFEILPQKNAIKKRLQK